MPVVANPPLARALYRVEVDADIPAEHYQAVAEIIAYVWRLGRRPPSRRHDARRRWPGKSPGGRDVTIDSCVLVIDHGDRKANMMLAERRPQDCYLFTCWDAAIGAIITRVPSTLRARTVATARDEEPLMEKNKALDAAMAQIERAFGKGSIMRMGSRGRRRADRGDPVRLARPRPGARHRRAAARADHRDLRPGKLRQDHAGAARDRRGAEARRHLRLHRRRARAGSRSMRASSASMWTTC